METKSNIEENPFLTYLYFSVQQNNIEETVLHLPRQAHLHIDKT